MKQIVLGNALALFALQLGGCIIEDGEDPFCGDGIVDPGEDCDGGANCTATCTLPVEDALITANWSIKSASTNQVLSCPPNITTAAVYSQPVNDDNEPVGQAIIDLFDCVDNTGTTDPLPADVYQVWVSLTSDGGGQVYATSTKWPAGIADADRNDIVDVRTSDKTFSTTLLEDGGYFALSWDLVDAQNNAPLTCAQAMSDGVSVISTSVANPNSFVDDVFNCEAGFGITGGLLQGTYTVQVAALENEQSIGDAMTLTNKVIRNANQITDLGLVVIPVD